MNETGDMTHNFFKTKDKKESELEPKLKKKKPPDFVMLDFGI